MKPIEFFGGPWHGQQKVILHGDDVIVVEPIDEDSAWKKPDQILAGPGRRRGRYKREGDRMVWAGWDGEKLAGPYGLEHALRDIYATPKITCLALPRKAWELVRDQAIARNEFWMPNDGPWEWSDHKAFKLHGVSVKVLQGPL